MSLIETVGRYRDFSVTASTYFFSKPPPFSEELRLLNIQKTKVHEESIDKMLYPLEKGISQILSIGQGGANSNWCQLSWQKGKKADLFRLIDVMIPFMDDTKNYLDEYFCKPKIDECISQLTNSTAPVLDIETQLAIIQPTAGNVWEKLYNLALAHRVLARNRDQKVGLSTNLQTSISVLKRLPVFPDLDPYGSENYSKNIATNAGEWYHFLSTIVLGAAFEHHKKEVNMRSLEYKFKFWGFKMIFTKTGELAKLLRPKANKCGFHEYSDLIGFNTGRSLAISLDNKG